jgi:hypothetical protein
MTREPVVRSADDERTRAEKNAAQRERDTQRTAAARAALAVKQAKRIQLIGWKAVDLNSPGAVAVKEWRADLLHALGGEDALTPQKKALVNAASLTMLIISRLDDLILVSSGPLVDSNTFEVLPFILQREALVDGLSRRLKMLGLERAKPKHVTDLRAFSAELAARRAQSTPDASDNTDAEIGV